MKTGLDYIFSREKRSLDLAIASMMQPGAKLSQTALWMSRGFNDDLTFRQKRVGANGETIGVHKMVTLSDVPDDNGMLHPINTVAGHLRRHGLDELAQYRNILEGTMSAVGYRPIIRSQWEDKYDGVSTATQHAFDEYVSPTRPGIVDAYSLALKTGQLENTSNQHRMEVLIESVRNASLLEDLLLIRSAATAVIMNRMKNGISGIHMPPDSDDISQAEIA